MGKNATGLFIGLAAGVVIGAIGYKFAQTEQADEFKDDAVRAWLKARIKARKAYRSARGKAADLGMKAADKMADGAHVVAEKADELKVKVADYNGTLKK